MTLSEISSLVRDGRFAEATEALRALPTTRVKREDATTLANLWRRVGVPSTSIRILAKYVRPAPRSFQRHEEASAAERAIYAAALLDMGSLIEAHNLLAKIPPAEYPRASFFLGLSLVRQWDWKSAVPAFENFLEVPGLDTLDRLGCQVFVGSCLLHGTGNIAGSRSTLEGALAEATELNHQGVVRNARLLLAQNDFFDNRYEEGMEQLRVLSELSERYGDEFSMSFVLKWRALFELKKDPTSVDAAKLLEEAKNRLRAQKQWGRVRGIALYEAMILKDPARFSAVWHGSPYPAVRQRILEVAKMAEIPSTHDWWLPPTQENPEKAGDEPVTVRVADGWNSLGGAFLKEGQVQQRLLSALAEERFQPLPLALLHERIYPGDHFSALSSATRVHQAIHRLREWLHTHRIPLRIHEEQGQFSLVAVDRGCILRLGELGPAKPSARQQVGLKAAQERFGTERFTVQQLARVLKVSRPTAFRWIERVSRDGLADRQAMMGRATYYRLRQPSA